MKKREKVLTLEEIKKKIFETTTTLWLNSTPILGLVPYTDGLKITPLTQDPTPHHYVLFFVDIGDYFFDVLLDLVSELKKKYRHLPWTPVIAIQQKYLFIRNPKFLERMNLNPLFNSVPIYFDAQGDWFDLFDAKTHPKAVIIQNGIPVFSEALTPKISAQWMKLETVFQKVLRTLDPGLPLFPIDELSIKRPLDTKIYAVSELALGGNWVRAGDSVVSEDSNASITLPFEGSRLRLIASTHPNAREAAKFVITFNDEPLTPPQFGAQVKLGDKSSSVSEVSRTQGINELIKFENAQMGTVKIKFTNAVENPIIIYGFRSN